MIVCSINLWQNTKICCVNSTCLATARDFALEQFSDIVKLNDKNKHQDMKGEVGKSRLAEYKAICVDIKKAPPEVEP